MGPAEPHRSGHGRKEHRPSPLLPFTAHENLCFGLRSLYHVGDKPIAPVFISRDRENGYTVWACHPYEGRRNAEARKLDTTDPKQADAETERLLAEWP
jgi:hypothetical protein